MRCSAARKAKKCISCSCRNRPHQNGNRWSQIQSADKVFRFLKKLSLICHRIVFLLNGGFAGILILLQLTSHLWRTSVLFRTTIILTAKKNWLKVLNSKILKACNIKQVLFYMHLAFCILYFLHFHFASVTVANPHCHIFSDSGPQGLIKGRLSLNWKLILKD